jgi:gamma-glutamyltranspeptidase/glutathione hydrolase
MFATRGVALCALLLISVSSAFADGTPARPGQAAIASPHPLATEAGLEVLRAGGNAFDAAVAVSAALGVVEPYGSGLGGGGFWLLHRAEDGLEVMIDGRETAPGDAHRDMFLDEVGQPVPRLSQDTVLGAGIPGLPAGLVHLSAQYGRLPLGAALAPALRYAEEGFEAYPRLLLGLSF